MRVLFLLLAICGCFSSSSVLAEINASAEENAKPWTSLEPLDDPEDFYFAVVTDRTGSHRDGVFPAAMDKLNLIEPAFVVSVGDFIEGYTENPVQLKSEWDEFEGFVDRLSAPFFYTPGNHDMSNALMAEAWQRRFGPSFYHFTYKDVLFVSLNSELFGMVEDPDTPVPGPWRQEEQMNFVRQVLQEYKDVRWTVVLVHQPLWDPSPNREINPDWLAVETLLGDRKYTVFAGHYHRYTKARRHDRSYITLATTGGGSQLRGPMWGEFDHVALVKMAGTGPRIANLVLDGILDENVSTLATRESLELLQNAVVPTATVSNDESFTQAPFHIEVTNPMPAPLSVSGATLAQTNFDIAGLKPITVAPGETQSIALTLSAEDPIPHRALHTTAIQWTLTTQDANQQALQVEIVTPVLPLTNHRIQKTTAPVQIDGNLNDWSTLPYAVTHQGDIASPPTSPEDISFRFDIKSGEDALFITVAVTDDHVVASPDLLARLQDSVAIMVDTRPDEDRQKNLPVVPAIIDGFYGDAVVQILTLNGATSDTFIPALDTWAEQVESAVVASQSGYTLEMAIPHDVLDTLARARWKNARIGIRAYDLDPDDNTVTTLHWQPYRFGNAPLAGTHAFRRAD